VEYLKQQLQLDPKQRSLYSSEETKNQPENFCFLEIKSWLLSQLGKQLRINSEQIDSQKSLTDYGLDSLIAIDLSGELSNILGFQLPPDIVLNYPTIDSLSLYLANQSEPLPNTLTQSMNIEKTEQLLENLDKLEDQEVERLLSSLMSI
jgi:acyl carrier protein